MWIGWGAKSRQWPMEDGWEVVARSRYFSLMFVPLIVNTKWFLLNNDRSQDQQLSRADLQARYGDNTPQVNIWSRFGLLFCLGALLLFILISAAFGG